MKNGNLSVIPAQAGIHASLRRIAFSVERAMVCPHHANVQERPIKALNPPLSAAGDDSSEEDGRDASCEMQDHATLMNLILSRLDRRFHQLVTDVS
jgi:hypothetical protein